MAIVAGPGVQLLDVSGPLDVFAEANGQAGRAVYQLQVLAGSSEPIRSSSGVRLLPDALTGEAGPPPHTLLVAGAPHMAHSEPDPGLVAWLGRTAPLARRYGSVCSGAFLLAAAGLLDGKRVTTHWAAAEQLSRRFPAVSVDANAIYLRDGRLRTAAGVTAGLDLALALVEEDLGRELAMRVASQLVMFFKRPGGQSQFSRKGEAAPVGRSVLQEVQRWAAANPSADLSVPALARRAGLSERHFARLFRQEVGMAPGRWVDATRVIAVRQLLERNPNRLSRGGFPDAGEV